ncbi:MAG: hypothetical protein CM1200mP41_18030 [Gammaproteobacteria bacterium]|nr:MAG: hypothetical protein CM1200mP41_18030 [Gammaproteobacteria bacterium]
MMQRRTVVAASWRIGLQIWWWCLAWATRPGTSHRLVITRLTLILSGRWVRQARLRWDLAMARPEKRIVLFVGDGELLMSLGVLATIANQAPANLAVVALETNLTSKRVVSRRLLRAY